MALKFGTDTRWCTDSQAVEGRPTALARLAGGSDGVGEFLDGWP